MGQLEFSWKPKFGPFKDESSAAPSPCSELAPEMESTRKRGYTWAVGAGLNAALAAVSVKLIASQIIRCGLVILFNVTMWGCYVNSLKSLSSLQATVTNFATNFLTSGFAGFFLFDELLTPKWFAGAFLIVIGVIVLSKSSIESKSRTD